MQTFDKSFSRTLTSADVKHNIPFPFEVPLGTAELTLRLAFAPWRVDGRLNMLTLTLFDPTGARGAGHRHGDVHTVVLSQASATPGYRAGPLPAGEWTAVVDTHMIMPGAPLELRLDVKGTTEVTSAPTPTREYGKIGTHGRGWYRGDLHAHTTHSDARWELDGLLDWAKQEQLDFCTLSDHNTVSGMLSVDAAPRPDLLLIGGMELTTFWGHALALGVREWIDWRVRPSGDPRGERTMEQIAAEVTARGGLFIIAHPKAIGDPECTGCRWVYEEMQPGSARAVEVWNDPWSSPSDNDEDALALAFDWLNRGYRLALTAGTDNHGGDMGGEPYGFNVVQADDLTEHAILSAVRAGRLYLSSGPRLALTAAVNGQTFGIGDTVNAANGAEFRLNAQWQAAPPDAQLSLIVDGVPSSTVRVGTEGAHAWTLKGGSGKWGVVTLRRADGVMLALTNPIYLDSGLA